MDNTNTHTHRLLIVLIIFFALGFAPSKAISLRDARELCKEHRVAILAITSAAVVYLYSHKLIEKAIHDYYHPKDINKQEQPKSTLDHCETYADILIKSTKLIGTIFKVLRAATCPDAGKISGDQWFDDFAGLA